jgi:hypothetical protein
MGTPIYVDVVESTIEENQEPVIIDKNYDESSNCGCGCGNIDEIPE